MTKTLFTSKDLPDFVKSITGEVITERTARNWLDGFSTATDQKRPKQYDLDTILAAMNSNLKRLNLSKKIHKEKLMDLEEQKQIEEMEKAEIEYLKNVDWDEVRLEEERVKKDIVEQLELMAQADAQKEYEQNVIKIMLQTLLKTQGIMFDEEKYKSDLLVKHQWQYFRGPEYVKTTEVRETLERLNNLDYFIETKLMK